jgi:hypothetical protein
MRKLWLYSIVVPLVLSLVACSDNDSSSNSNTFTIPTGKPAGRFVRNGDVAIADKGVNYCSDGEVKLDPLLKVGQSIVQVTAEMNVDGTYGRQLFGPLQSIQVLALAKDSITRKYNFTVSGKKGSYTEACRFKIPTGEGHQDCEYNFSSSTDSSESPVSPEELESIPNTAWCFVTNSDHLMAPEKVSGVYIFPSGRKVKATFTKTKTTGDISCWNAKTSQSEIVGRGVGISEVIESSEVPNIDAPTNCNSPTIIYSYSKNTLEDGTLKSHEQTEIIQATF